jgi:SapC
MVNMVPVTPARLGGRGWRRPTGYDFIAKHAVVPLGGSELSQAVPAMPIGFIEHSPGAYVLVAMMALSKGSNVFVGPGGQWLGSYVPAVLRSYPFSLIGSDGSEQKMLAIDEDSGLLVDDPAGEGVEKFFEPDGSEAPATKSVTELLRFMERDLAVTNRAVAALAEAGLVKPWPLTVQVGNQQLTVNGLHCIDERALNALADASFLQLRRTSSLIIAYGHLLSMTQVGLLTRLTLLRQQMAEAGKPAGESATLPL